MRIGYARVSTSDQNIVLQTDALEKAGCERIYADRGVSGTKSSRPELDRKARVEGIKNSLTILVRPLSLR